MWLWFLLKISQFLRLGSKKFFVSPSTFLELDGQVLALKLLNLFTLFLLLALPLGHLIVRLSLLSLVVPCRVLVLIIFPVVILGSTLLRSSLSVPMLLTMSMLLLTAGHVPFASVVSPLVSTITSRNVGLLGTVCAEKSLHKDTGVAAVHAARAKQFRKSL